jgi:hypothetical protein
MSNSLFDFGKASVETKITGLGHGDSPTNFTNEPHA